MIQYFAQFYVQTFAPLSLTHHYDQGEGKIASFLKIISLGELLFTGPAMYYNHLPHRVYYVAVESLTGTK